MEKKVKVTVYPNPLASLAKSLEALLQEPYGCFEQTSSVNYPTVMAAQYFATHSGVDESIKKKANEMLEKGYKRLISFESQGGGFEWFGESPGGIHLINYFIYK